MFNGITKIRRERPRFAFGLAAAVCGAALYFGLGAAQAQVVTSFATACSTQPPGTTVKIGPFFTGDVAQGASAWSVSPGVLTPGYANSAWVPIASAIPAQPTGANWIAVAEGLDNTNYTYTLTQPITVNPAIIDPASISVTGNYAADNYVTAIQVGASSVNVSSFINQFGSLTLFDIATDAPNLGSLFQTGDNTLSFVVYNLPGNPSDNPDGLYANVSISATCVGSPAITIDKQVVTPSDPSVVLAPGDPVEYTVTVTNTSAVATATNVQVADPVPSGLDASTITWSCSSATGAASCADASPGSGGGDLASTLATLPPGSSVTYTISGNAAASVSGAVTNTATASGADVVCADGQALPCPAQARIPFAAADMQATASSVTVGNQVTVTLTCTNAGPSDAEAPTCAVNTSAAPGAPAPSCTAPAQPGVLAVGERIICTTTFTSVPGVLATLVVTAGSSTPDPNRANNTARASIRPARQTGSAAASVPALTPTALALLALLLASGTALTLRRKPG